MSEPRFSWIATARSGVSSSSAPSMCERNVDPVVGDLADLGEAEDLEAAGVGEDRPVPAHEAVQAAQLGDQLVAGPQGRGGRCCRG